MRCSMKGEIRKMSTIVSFIILVGMGIICAVIHKNKGYSPVAGFCWGFFFSIIGLIIVLLERNKEEQMDADKGGLSMAQWLLIFLGVGIILIVIFFIVMSLM